jgi:hypothetical protein
VKARRVATFAILEGALLVVCAALAGAKFRADELPPDLGAIVRFNCIAHDEHGTSSSSAAPGAVKSQVRWLAEATAMYREGHDPAEWHKTIAMTPWEPENGKTKSQIGKMGTYCVEWAQEVGRQQAKARGAK